MKKTVILGVSGGIAAYKACEIVSRLGKLGYGVRVVMTKNAAEFVTPLTFETLSGHKVVTENFDKDREFEVEHISYAKLASVFVIAPATANVIGKIACGVADDFLTTTVTAIKCPVLICPAMNTAMYENPAVVENIKKLKERGFLFVEPLCGLLACGDVGKGKMAEPVDIVSEIDKILTPNPDFRGKKFLITAGATEEPVDGVRFITNRSSGKMGIALAEAAAERGGEVTLVCGRISVSPPESVRVIRVSTTAEMYGAVMENTEDADIIIKAAAPADYRVKNFSPHKIKADTLTLEFVKNPDIAAAVGKRKGNRKLVVFAAETDDLLANARKKLDAKNADLIVANDVGKEGAGFDADTNIATLISSSGSITPLDIMTKRELADVILDALKED